MATSVSQLSGIISRAAGVSLAHTKQVSRRLLEADMLPRSVGAAIAGVSYFDAIVLLLGVLAQTEIHATPSVARQLFDLPPVTGSRNLGFVLYELLQEIGTLDDGAAVAMDGQVIVDAYTPRAVVRLNVSGEVVESVFAHPGADELTADEIKKLVVLPTIVLGKIAIALGRKATKAAA
jgi:sulfur carrier protein ThiS